ncbi:MAG: glutathionylspermidine synthase family protein [Myxococcales bacterium]
MGFPGQGDAMIEVRPLAGDAMTEPSVLRELGMRYFIWDTHVEGERRIELAPLVLSQALHESAVRTAERVARVVGRVARRALVNAGERRLYQLPDEAHLLAQASHEGGDTASLVRVDLLLDMRRRWQVCEINADCPGGHNEALALPTLARLAGFRGGLNPTRVFEHLVARLAKLAQRDGEQGAVGLLYATAYAEDLQVCALVAEGLRARGVKALLASPTAPTVHQGKLVIRKTPVSALYRFFPTEWMPGQHNVRGLAEVVATGAVRTLSSFSQIYAQSKLSMARTWRTLSSLGQDDREAVMQALPFTADVRTVDRAELVGDARGWVLKGTLGRVGEEVLVGALSKAWGEDVDDVLERAESVPWIAQRYVVQPRVRTPWGPRYVTLGVYLMDGVFVGYFARLTRTSHVGHDALCVPVFFEAA